MGAKRDCTHPKARHRHGTELAYIQDACRCPDCTEAMRRDRDRRRKEQIMGINNALVDPTPARQHVRKLMAHGMGITHITAASGVPGLTVSNLIYSDRPTVQRITADSLLAVKLEPQPHGRVPSVGARRRMQALACLGWTTEAMADMAGISRRTAQYVINHKSDTTEYQVHAKIGALFERLCLTPPPEATSRQKRAAGRARRVSREKGWVPPLAWDDIDNPDAQPQGIAKPHQRTIPTREDIAAELAHPAFAGSTRLLADAMGVQPESITRRIQRKDAA